MPAKIKYPVINGMKECGDCHEMKPIERYRPARGHYESKCPECKKAYAAEYRKRPEIVEKNRKYHAAYNRDPEKRASKNEYIREWRGAWSKEKKAHRNEQRRLWAVGQKQKGIDYKGGKCQICGYDKYAGALEFHHIDPTEKESPGTGAFPSHWTFERARPELDKCMLVCVRCHREIHGGVTVWSAS